MYQPTALVSDNFEFLEVVWPGQAHTQSPSIERRNLILVILEYHVLKSWKLQFLLYFGLDQVAVKVINTQSGKSSSMVHRKSYYS